MSKSKSIFKDKKVQIIIIIVIALIAIILAWGISKTLETDTVSSEIGQYDMIGKEIKLTNKIKKDMYEKVKKDILEDLKTPSTAVFPKMKDWKIEVNHNIIEVKSHVDSQNGYGAMLRADFEQDYILLNKDEYFCIYKEFDDEIKFYIAEKTICNAFVNEEIDDDMMEAFMTTIPTATRYANLIDYSYSKENKDLEVNLQMKNLDNRYFSYRTYIDDTISSFIDQCISIPTVTTKLNIKNEKEEIVATVKNINLEFLLNDWYTLWNLGVMNNTDETNLEEKLKDKLWIAEELNNSNI